MTNNTTPEVFGNIADQLVTLEVRAPAMRADVMRPLLEAARTAAAGKPKPAWRSSSSSAACSGKS
jgi:hypothetical protein